MEALSHLRTLIATLDQPLVDALCARARFRRNETLYGDLEQPPPSLQSIAGPFADAATLAGRVRILRASYLSLLLPTLCEPGADDRGPACVTADAACLDALARRLALSVHVATRKLEALPENLQTAIQDGNPRALEQAITNLAVEDEVLARVKARAADYASRSDIAERIATLYADWIIPLSRKIQVYGLLAESAPTRPSASPP
jgi:chorismate mutase